MDRPTNRPTDRHDLLSLDDDTQQNQIDIYDKWAISSILSQMQRRCIYAAESFFKHLLTFQYPWCATPVITCDHFPWNFGVSVVNGRYFELRRRPKKFGLLTSAPMPIWQLSRIFVQWKAMILNIGTAWICNQRQSTTINDNQWHYAYNCRRSTIFWVNL